MRFRVMLGVCTLLAGLAACDERTPPTAPSPATDDGVAAAGSIPTCGFEGDGACLIAPRCDRGLQVDGGGTILPGDDTCVNDTRHLVGPAFRGSWLDWALANQRTLGIDEPINWVQQLSTHNAYNNLADGETFDPNQVWSISDQLDLGSRLLWLDPHWIEVAGTDVTGQVRLCHAHEFAKIGLHVGCGAWDRPLAHAMKEVSTWLAANPSEIVMIDLEAYVEGHDSVTADALEAFLDPMLYRATDRTDPERWPTRRELLEMGKRAIVVARGVNFRSINHPEWIPPDFRQRFVNHLQVFRQQDIIIGCASREGAGPLISLVAADDSFRVVGEDRGLVTKVAYFTGFMDPIDVENLAACNVSLQSLDMLSPTRGNPPAWMTDRLDELRQIPGRVPDGELHHLMVWSWAEGDRGGGGDAALLRGASGRWSSASTDGQYRFACGRERSETRRLGEGKSAWPDLLGLEWRVTTRAGAWREGGRACLDEFGADGFVFSVPVNGLMNGRLRLADAPRGDVWLNYNDIEAEGSWEINQRPVANAGADQMHECEGHHGVHVTLNGTASSDPDGQSLTYEWRGPFGTATGASPTVAIPLGRHEVVLVVDDGLAGVSADTVVITVVDTKPPVIHSASPSPATLWAPNHKMEAVTVTVDVSDICDPAPACRIVSVSSNESVNGQGDGNTAPDWRLVAPLVVELRAERSGKGSGRVYTLGIECTDSSGNAAATQVVVTVAHDQGRP